MNQSLKITAAVIEAKGTDFKLQELEIRPPVEDEVLVKIVATGMCHTDLIVRDQYYPVPLPAVLGHEGAGVIQAIGPNVKDLAVGDHVVLSYGYCGKCNSCNTGNPAYCIEFLDVILVGLIYMDILRFALMITSLFMTISLPNLLLPHWL